MTTLRSRHVSAVLAAVVLLTGGCAGQEARSDEPSDERPDERPDGRLVLVSGRDDHGNQQAESVALHDGPDQVRVVGEVPDGTLARVGQLDGQMLEVTTVEGTRLTGWVDDFHLRGTLHLVGPAPSCRARLAGALREPGMQVVVLAARGGEVLVESVVDPDVRGSVDRHLVQELPPRGPSCGREHAEHDHKH